MKFASEFFQLAATIVGILSTILVIAKGYRELRRTPAADPLVQPSDVKRADSVFKNVGSDKQELALVLLLASLLCLISIQSVLFAGQIPSLNSISVLICIAVTVILVASSVLSWYFGVVYKVLLVLTLTTSAVLIFSRSGPFNVLGGVNNIDSGNGILAPLLVLTSLITAIIIRQCESWIPANSQARRRLMIVCVSIPIAVCSLAQGRRFLQGISTDERAPKPPSQPAQAILDELSAQPGAEHEKLFYRIASDINLAQFYANQYNNVNDRLTRKQIDPQRKVSLSLFSPPSDDETLHADRKLENFQNPLVYIPMMYSSFSVGTQADYLLHRLEWVYPLGMPSAIQAPIGLPGVTSQQRLQNISDARVVVALRDQELLRRDLMGSFEYPSSVRSLFAPKDSQENELATVTNLYKRVFSGSEAETVQPPDQLFPSEDLPKYSMPLGTQLGLPLAEESFVAFSEYQIYSLHLSNAQITVLLKQFQALPHGDQQAFVHYVASSDTSAKNMEALATVADVDFDSFLKSAPGPYPMQSLADAVERTSGAIQIAPATSELGKVTEAVFKKVSSSAATRANVVQLFRRVDPEASVSTLFDRSILTFILEVNKGLNEQDREQLLKVIADPVALALGELIETKPELQSLGTSVKAFSALTSDDRERTLHNLALRLYRSDGPNSLGLVKQAVMDASSLSVWLGTLVAAAAFTPLFGICAAVGFMLSRRLAARDRLQNSIFMEYQRDVYSPTGDELVPLAGRDRELLRIARLSTRNRSTIALTGRRGSGKSRLLREVFRGEIEKGRVGVWIDCPTTISQEEFVSSLLERLALAIEKACARFAGDPDLAVRKFEVDSLLQLGIVCAVVVLALIGMSIALLSSMPRPELLGLWTPAALVATAAIALLAWEYLRLRESTAPGYVREGGQARFHLSALYSKSIGILNILRDRAMRERESGRKTAVLTVRLIALVCVGLLASYEVVNAAFYQPPKGMVAMMGLGDERAKGIAIALSGVVIWIMIFLMRPTQIQADYSVLSLIGTYREFAFESVYRIKSGALGSPAGGIVVCIDELDKLGNIEDVKLCLRVAKTLFDIEGVSYYLSIAEDALIRMTLGSVTGKDEFDSSFDHVERIRALEIGDGVRIVQDYLDKESVKYCDAATRCLVFLAFGVPRDMIRKCETAIAAQIDLVSRWQSLFQTERAEIVESASLVGFLSSSEAELLLKSADESRTTIRQLLSSQKWEGQRPRVLCALGILLTAECNASAFEKTESTEIAGLMNLGYDLPILTITDLHARSGMLWQTGGPAEGPTTLDL